MVKDDPNYKMFVKMFFSVRLGPMAPGRSGVGANARRTRGRSADARSLEALSNCRAGAAYVEFK